MRAVWDGITRNGSLHPGEAALRHRVADAAKAYQWGTLLKVLADNAHCINVTRPGGSSCTRRSTRRRTVGHPRQWWRSCSSSVRGTLCNAAGERPLDIARARGHTHLLRVLEPELRHDVDAVELSTVQGLFHGVILSRVSQLVHAHQLRLPELAPLLELRQPEMWFAVPGMYGGFSFRLTATRPKVVLVSSSWCRVVGGSEEEHEVTAEGSRFLGRGPQ